MAFGLIGLILGSWAGRIPALQDGLQIPNSTLSLVLLCGGLGGVLSYPLASRMTVKLGGRKTLLYAGLASCLVLPAIGLAATVPLLMLAVMMLGLTSGCYGVGMNSLAAKYEKSSGKPQMSMLHAWCCGGSLTGVLLSSVAADAEIKPAAHFIAVALPIALLLWLSYGMLEADDHGEAIEKKKFTLPSGPIALLGVLGLCASMSQNSICDWSGVFLKEQFGVTDGFAPLALSAFTVMMLLCRLVGDKLKEKHGARRLISVGAGISAAGLFLAVLAPNPYLALVGFACSGMGLSLVFPFVFSAVGKEGPLALTAVATMCNIGGLMGPPIIGTMAGYLDMQAAIGFIGLLSILISLVAARSTLLK